MIATATYTPDVRGDVERHLQSKSKLIPHQSNWASQLGSPCLRQLTYQRTDWEKQLPPEPGLQGIFETGTRLERVVLSILNEVGETGKPRWELVNGGIKLNDAFMRTHQIGGVPDCFLRAYPNDRGEILGPVEVKSMAPHIFDSVDTLDDFQRKPWTRKYPAQLALYELASGFERGWFLLFNKSNIYDYKFLEMPLDYSLAESLIQKADAVNNHISMGTLPERLNDPDECGRCPFAAICCPDYKTGGNFSQIVNDELEALLDKLEELDAAATEYDSLARRRDKMLEDVKGQNMLIGKYLIRWTEKSRTTKPSPGGTSTYWAKNITRVPTV